MLLAHCVRTHTTSPLHFFTFFAMAQHGKFQLFVFNYNCYCIINRFVLILVTCDFTQSLLVYVSFFFFFLCICDILICLCVFSGGDGKKFVLQTAAVLSIGADTCQGFPLEAAVCTDPIDVRNLISTMHTKITITIIITTIIQVRAPIHTCIFISAYSFLHTLYPKIHCRKTKYFCSLMFALNRMPLCPPYHNCSAKRFNQIKWC